jgi:predicted dehydrogenase
MAYEPALILDVQGELSVQSRMTQNAQSFRVGIIGAGAVTSTLHLPAALASPHIVVTALVDPVVERARKLAQEYGLETLVTDRIEAALAEVDGVVIATPNHTHRDIAIMALRAGVPCLVEKPLATTVADAEAICAAAEDANKVVAVGYTTRFRDEVVLLKELLAARYFGAIERFHYQEGTIGGWSPLSGYTIDRAASGGGVLTVVGTHFLDRLLYWFGYPDRCSLEDDARGGPEAHCLATFQFGAHGAKIEGTLLLSKVIALRPGLVIRAERGDVIFPMGRSPLYFRPRESENLQIVLTPRGSRKFSLVKQDAQLELEDFVDACRGLKLPMVDARAGLLSVKLLNELYANRTQIRETWLERSAAKA